VLLPPPLLLQLLLLLLLLLLLPPMMPSSKGRSCGLSVRARAKSRSGARRQGSGECASPGGRSIGLRMTSDSRRVRCARVEMGVVGGGANDQV
jgi:hypothetical protein